jgi:hypothetical protein
MKYANPEVHMVFNDETGYFANTIPCKDRCTCAYCSSACSNSTKELLPDFTCRIFGIDCFFIGGGFVFMVLIIMIITISVSIFERILYHVQEKKKVKKIENFESSSNDIINEGETSNLLIKSDNYSKIQN